MQMKQLLPAVLLLSLLTPVRTFACACCSNEGEYHRNTAKVEQFQRDLLKDMRFDSKAFLYSGEAGPEEESMGITEPKNEYGLSGSLAGKTFRLTFRDGSKSGLLTLPLPLRMENYKVDLHDGQAGGGGGPVLYKEWRFDGMVTGTGLFKAGIVGPTKYFLVLQGRGNNCDNAEDFTNWRLEVRGKRAKYAFYGKLVK